MKLETFEMERQQSIWENEVEINLTESGVHPLTLDELLAGEPVGNTLLGYPQTNGTTKLRELVSELYPGSSPDNVLVTNGASEANFLSILNLVEQSDEIVVMLPNYLQIWGLARSLGAQTKSFPLLEEQNWAPDLEALQSTVNEKTKLIAICNPNNPTGAVMSENAMRSICKIAGSVGAWILADEVYLGTELDGESASTFWGWYDRLIVTSGLSKAFALPGLRIGWIVTKSEQAQKLWAYKDYTSIAPGALSDRLARIALEPARRHKILERTRNHLKEQLPIISEWVALHREAGLHLVSPKAGAMAFVRYGIDLGSRDLTDRLRKEKSLLVVPGEYFQMDRYVRIGYGGERHTVKEGLKRFSEMLSELSI